MDDVRLMLGDCLGVMRRLPENSVEAVVTDPPYGLRFMGKDWDSGLPGITFWAEMLRIAKPGAHLLAFGGTRTHHRLMVAIEDAGWEIRDTVMWVYSTGFPKSLDVSKAIDKAAGTEREVVGTRKLDVGIQSGSMHAGRSSKVVDRPITAPATDAARQWEGWGTALKPAWEPIVLARKPLSEPTVAANVVKWGTGALNVDATRIRAQDNPTALRRSYGYRRNTERAADSEARGVLRDRTDPVKKAMPHPSDTLGRWPANLVHDDSEEVVGLFPVTAKGTRSGYNWQESNNDNPTRITRNIKSGVHFGDSGSAARFFYCAKASKADRDEGLEGMDEQPRHTMSGGECIAEGRSAAKGKASARNYHPTVKPTALMRYLCRLVTPPGGVVLDPFMGSGSTGKAAVQEGFRFVGMEIDEEYYAIAERRIEAARQQLRLPLEPR